LKGELPPATARRLAKLGIGSRAALALHLPLRYEDETALTPLDRVPAGKPVLVQARVVRAEVAYRPKRQLLVHAEGLVLRFFNFYGSQLKQFERAAADGLQVRAFGEVRPGWFGAEMTHPRYRLVHAEEPLADALTPIYPTTAGLAQGVLRKLVLESLAGAALDETLPAELRERYGLAGFAESIGLLHRAPPGADVGALSDRTHPAWRRMKFDELLAQQLSMRLAYRARRTRRAPPLRTDGPLLRRFSASLPFRLTRAQARASSEVLRDLAAPHPMQRLLQGDVGSGKTIVAALACLAAADSAWQAAVMAPTEILAEQHRFGVQQRLALRKRAAGALLPHQLMMSATPIPRTLSMTYYADLDVSLIDELPPGRKTVATRLVSDARRGEVLSRIRTACADGQQVYWVCPVIEESREGEVRTALATHALLASELKGLRVGLLHGRLPPEEKAAAMAQFGAGRIQLLVATTVIEVGVDVPNASLMVIEHAERFGLAQLHQLRGRIGRGARESVCILLYAAPLSAAARARLKVIFENRDGFEIARQDLLLRGPGEVLGERQSGLPLLRFADLERDEPLIAPAREAARWLLEHEPALARRHVERWLPQGQELARA